MRVLTRRTLVALVAATALLSACGGSGDKKTAGGAGSPTGSASRSSSGGAASASPSSGAGGEGIPGIYAHDQVGMFTDATRNVPYRVYVPNHTSGTVTVIDGNSMKVIDTFPADGGPQHVVPSWDLKTLYTNNDEGGYSLTPIDPVTGKRKGPNIPVRDPYNMYFTPEGKYMIVVAEALQRLDFRDPTTFKLEKSIKVRCPGVNHIDFAADLKTMVATCEFGGRLVKVDLTNDSVVGYLDLAQGGMPQDIKLDPQGQVYYVADMNANGVWLIDARTFTKIGFIATGPEAHGLYPSRDARSLYVSNRGGKANQGSVTVIDFATRKIVANWPIPGGGTPDMGGVSADGKVLWLSGRRSDVVYAFDTSDGHILARIPVGREPHGLCVWPQPGRFSLGHTGILR